MREERQAEGEKEIKLAELEARGKSSVASTSDLVSKPTLPSYKDEDIAVYLTRFEQVAQLLEIEEDT